MPFPPSACMDWLRQHQSLVVVAPHPDDEIFGCYGLIRQAQALNLPVEVHIATDGERCFGALAPAQEQQLRQRRRQESIAAGRQMGYTPCFWELGDGQLSAQMPQLHAQLARHWQPGALWVTSWWHDGHPDHEALGHSLRAWGRQHAAPTAYYPVWALMDPARQALWLAQPQRCALALDSAAHHRKQEMAALFATQYQAQPQQAAIVSRECLARFTAHVEHYLYAA